MKKIIFLILLFLAPQAGAMDVYTYLDLSQQLAYEMDNLREAKKISDTIKIQKSRDLIKALVTRNTVNMEIRGQPLLTWSALCQEKELFKFFLELGADVKAKKKRKTALYFAAEIGDCEIIQALIKKNAIIDIEWEDLREPLYIATRKGHIGAVQLLLDNYPKKPIPHEFLVSMMTSAISGGHEKLIELLPAYGIDMHEEGNFFLDHALLFSTEQCIETILNYDFDINVSNHYLTPLQRACERIRNSKIINLLLAHKADPNAHEGCTRTPLEFVIKKGHEHTEKVIQSFFVSTHFPLSESTKERALNCAIENYNIKALKIILEHFTAINADALNQAAYLLHHDKQYFWDKRLKVIKLLIKFGAYKFLNELCFSYLESLKREIPTINLNDPSLSSYVLFFNDAKQGNFEMIKDFLKDVDSNAHKGYIKGFDINTRDENYDTLLHHAVRHRNREIAQLLLTHGADLKAINKAGQSPVQLAVDLEMPGIIDINTIRNEHNETLLHQAVRKRNASQVKKLLAMGADPTLTNNRGLNPVQLVMKTPWGPRFVGLFVHAATPLKHPAPNLFKDQIATIEQHLEHIKAYNSKKKLLSLARIGYIATAAGGLALATYSIVQAIRTRKRSGLFETFKKHWIKFSSAGIAAGAAGALSVVHFRGQDQLTKQKQNLDQEKKSIVQGLTSVKGFIKPDPLDSAELASQKLKLVELIKQIGA